MQKIDFPEDFSREKFSKGKCLQGKLNISRHMGGHLGAGTHKLQIHHEKLPIADHIVEKKKFKVQLHENFQFSWRKFFWVTRGRF